MSQAERAEFGRAFGVSRETLDRLAALEALVQQWSRGVNLVSAGDLPRLWPRHIADSLQLVPLLPAGVGRAIDIGSGAGFPAIPLAIATGCRFDLIEADHRKASFLREAIRLTQAPATVHTHRAEIVRLDRAPLVTARAVAPLIDLLALSHRLLTPGGICLFPKGASAAIELTDAARQWHLQVEQFPSRTDPTGLILRISGISRV